jgi:hypothetical protein
MEFLARLFGTTKPRPTTAERRAASVLADAEMLLTDVLSVHPWPIPEGFSDRGRAILERIDSERRGLRADVKARREQAMTLHERECARLRAEVIRMVESGELKVDGEHAARYARAKLIELGAELEPAE